MKFWSFLSSFWPRFGSANPGRQPRGTLAVDRLSEAEALEDRDACSAAFADAASLNRQRSAEVLFVSPSQRTTQRSYSRFLRLSVVAVDYLLEFEWFRLLSSVTNSTRSRARTRHATTRRPAAATVDDDSDETSRTACVDQANWSVTLDASNSTARPNGPSQ